MKTITTITTIFFGLIVALAIPASLFAEDPCPGCDPGPAKGFVKGMVNDSHFNSTVAGSDGSLNTVGGQTNSHTLRGKVLEPGFSGGAFADSGQTSFYNKGVEFGNGFAQHQGIADQSMVTSGIVDDGCPDMAVKDTLKNERTVATTQAMTGDTLAMSGSIVGKGTALASGRGTDVFVGGTQQWVDKFTQGIGDENNGAVQTGSSGGWTKIQVGKPQD